MPDVYAPKRIKPEIIQDMVLPAPQWGQPYLYLNTTTMSGNASITGVETTSPRRSGPAEIKHYDDEGNEITFKQKLALIYEDKKRQVEALRRSGRRASVGCSGGCCEIGAASLGPDIEDAINDKLGFIFHVKFCYLDKMEVRCVKRSDPNNRDADERQKEPGSGGIGEKRNADQTFTGVMPKGRPFTELFECKIFETLICLDEIPLCAGCSVCSCYKCQSPAVYEPKNVNVDDQAGLIELEIGKSQEPEVGPKCPAVEGLIKFRADLTLPDGKINPRMFSDADFLLEGCITALFPLDTCLAASVAPGSDIMVEKLKDAAAKVGVAFDFGSLFLETCVYLKTLGYEDPKCNAPAAWEEMGTGWKGYKKMPLNPGIKGAAGYIMANTITVPRIRRQCVTTTWKNPVTWWEKKGCCANINKCEKIFGKKVCVSVNTCVDCAKTRWEDVSREDCVDVITGVEEKSVATVRAALDVDMPLEIQCMSHRNFPNDGFGMGISFKGRFCKGCVCLCVCVFVYNKHVAGH